MTEYKEEEEIVSVDHLINLYCLPFIGMDSDSLILKLDRELNLNMLSLKRDPKMRDFLNFLVENITSTYKDTYVDVINLFYAIRRVIKKGIRGYEIISLKLSKIINTGNFTKLVGIEGNNREKAINNLAWFFTKAYMILVSDEVKIHVPLKNV